MLHKNYLRTDIMRSSFEITKREIAVSISIIAIMLLIGFLISAKISDYYMYKNEIYNKAIKIKDRDMFEYGMQTNAGNAFVYGKLKAVDTVTYPEIGGAYMYVEKIKEKYTEHTRVVTYTTGSGKNTQTHTRTETYWTWDMIDSDSIKCKEISFLDVLFNSNKIKMPDKRYIDTINESYYIRYRYYGTDVEFTGTIFTKLENKTISDETKFYNNKTIEETVDQLDSNCGIIMFWVVWSLFIVFCVYIFYYLDNRWLN